MAFNYYQPYTSYAQQETAHRLQRMRDEINDQLAQMQQQPAPQIQQTFITPSPDNSQMNIPAKWVNNYDEVKAANVYIATIFMDKNKPRFYMKDENGSIKSFDFIEVEELDEKDIKIRELENRIKELEGGNNNVKSVNEYDEQSAKTNGQSIATNINDTTKETKSTSI